MSLEFLIVLYIFKNLSLFVKLYSLLNDFIASSTIVLLLLKHIMLFTLAKNIFRLSLEIVYMSMLSYLKVFKF